MKIDGVYHCSDVAFEAGLNLAKVGLCRYTDCQNILATAFLAIAAVDGATLTRLWSEP